MPRSGGSTACARAPAYRRLPASGAPSGPPLCGQLPLARNSTNTAHPPRTHERRPRQSLHAQRSVSSRPTEQRSARVPRTRSRSGPRRFSMRRSCSVRAPMMTCGGFSSTQCSTCAGARERPGPPGPTWASTHQLARRRQRGVHLADGAVRVCVRGMKRGANEHPSHMQGRSPSHRAC